MDFEKRGFFVESFEAVKRLKIPCLTRAFSVLACRQTGMALFFLLRFSEIQPYGIAPKNQESRKKARPLLERLQTIRHQNQGWEEGAELRERVVTGTNDE